MRPLVTKLKPVSGFANLLHIGLLLVLPVLLYILIRLDFKTLALLVVILSKWRMFAVRPRFWAANIRANAVDIIVGVAVVLFMGQSDAASVQLLWAALYAIWLVRIKPGSSQTMIALQACIGQLAGLSALYVLGSELQTLWLTILTGVICYVSARHFFDPFDEAHARMLAFMWGYFGVALAWLLSHWLLYFSLLSQPVLLLSIIGYGLGLLYIFDHRDKLSRLLRQQFVFAMIILVVVVLALSDWGSKVV